MAAPPTALVVIDMLVDFFERQPALAAERARLVQSINDLVAAFRQAGQPVIWVRQEFKADLSDAFLNMRRDGIRITIEGTLGSEILPELDRVPGDEVVVKKRYSAFYRTPLDAILSSRNTAIVVLAGINTHACIRTAAIDAFQCDYEVIIAGDGIASYDALWHAETLRYVDGRIATVMANPEILAS